MKKRNESKKQTDKVESDYLAKLRAKSHAKDSNHVKSNNEKEKVNEKEKEKVNENDAANAFLLRMKMKNTANNNENSVKEKVHEETVLNAVKAKRVAIQNDIDEKESQKSYLEKMKMKNKDSSECYAVKEADAKIADAKIAVKEADAKIAEDKKDKYLEFLKRRQNITEKSKDDLFVVNTQTKTIKIVSELNQNQKRQMPVKYTTTINQHVKENFDDESSDDDSDILQTPCQCDYDASEITYEFSNSKGYSVVFTDSEMHTFLAQQCSNTGFDPISVRNNEKTEEEKLIEKENQLKKIANNKKQLKKMIKGPSKKAQEMIDKNKSKKEDNKCDADDGFIESMISQISNIYTLNDMGKWFLKLSTDEAVLKGLQLLFMNRNITSPELKCHIFIEINDRINILDLPHGKFKEALLKFRKSFDTKKEIEFCFNHRQHVMEPFSPIKHTKYKLEDFQREAADAIDRHENIVVSAPTSSGKTFIAQYCVVVNTKTVFLAPRQELVDQIAATIRSRKFGSLTYTPITHLCGEKVFEDVDSRVLIATPVDAWRYFMLNNGQELEYNIDDIDIIGTRMCKTFGSSSTFRISDVNFLVVDEFQQMNELEQGIAMQNIIKLLSKCPIALLTATIKNIDETVEWIKYIKHDTDNPIVNKITYNKRFINQQKKSYDDNGMHDISPLCVLTVELIQQNRLIDTEMQIPTQQLLQLAIHISNAIPEKTSEVDYVKFFEDKPFNLHTCKMYEDLLKYKLTEYSKTHSIQVEQILSNYKIEPQQLAKLEIPQLYRALLNMKHSNMLCAMVFIFDATLCRKTWLELLNFMIEDERRKYPLLRTNKELRNRYYKEMTVRIKHVENSKVKNTDVDGGDSKNMAEDRSELIRDEYLNNFKKEITRIITVEISKWTDAIKLLEAKESLTSIEHNTLETYKFNIYTYNIDLQKYNAMTSLSSVNEFAPHPDYTFSKSIISVDTMKKVKNTLETKSEYNAKKNKKKNKNNTTNKSKDNSVWHMPIEYTDPYMLAIERGFSFYTKDLKELDVRFQGITQMLINECGLEVIFSDASYAYGINLPIRTVVFYNPEFEDKGIININRILAHQAGGRSGRRGYDTVGYIVYIGVHFVDLILGEYLNITGHEPNDHFSLVPIMFNSNFEPKSLYKVSLADFTTNKTTDTLLLKENSNKMELIDTFNEYEDRIKEHVVVNTYRFKDYGDCAFVIQDFISFLTKISYQCIHVQQFDIIELFSSLLFLNEIDGNELLSISASNIMSLFAENQMNNGKVLVYGYCNNLIESYKERRIIKNEVQVLEQLKVIKELLRIVYSNHQNTTAHWVKVCKDTHKKISSLVFKYTI